MSTLESTTDVALGEPDFPERAATEEAHEEVRADPRADGETPTARPIRVRRSRLR